jgi:D-3-phosphoglycerate dehydrogenase
VAETKRTNDGDYQTLVRIIVTTDQGTNSVTGTLFGGDKPRLVEIDEVPIEAEVTPFMLFVRNEDKPGFIGKLGTTLGNASVNIATFHLGRTAPGANAICLVSVDQKVDEALLATIRALPSVVRATELAFA